MSIDFTSTKNGIDSQAQRCVRLIAAVIAQALKDLAVMENHGEIKRERNENADAINSIIFFGGQKFLDYAALVGFSGEEFLKRILIGGTTQEYDEKSKEWVSKPHAIPANYLSAMEIRTIRQRFLWGDFANRRKINAKT